MPSRAEERSGVMNPKPNDFREYGAGAETVTGGEVAGPPSPPLLPELARTGEWIVAMRGLGKEYHGVPHIPDEALRRENLYGEAGLTSVVLDTDTVRGIGIGAVHPRDVA